MDVPRRTLATTLLALVLLLSSCGTIQTVAEAPGNLTRSLLPGQQAPDKLPISQMAPEVLRFADFGIRLVRAAADEFAETVDTHEARVQAVEWRLAFTRKILETATRSVPLTAMLDLLVAAKAGRIAFEERMIPHDWGEPARPMLAAFEAGERGALEVLGEFLTDEQVADLQATLAGWEESERQKGGSAQGSIPTFRDIAQKLESTDQGSGKFLGLVQLNPLAGVTDEVAQQMAMIRQWAERTLFWTERVPMLVDDQLELATLKVQKAPEVTQILADVERVSTAADTIANTAAKLRDDLPGEREAIIRQLGEELSVQREGLIRDLESAQPPVESLLGESRATFDSAQAMTKELESLVAAVDSFLDRFEPEEGAPPPPEPEEPPRPFDIVEYGDTAARLGAAAAELRELVATLDASMPEVERMIDAAATRGDATLELAFRRGLQLGLALIAGTAVAVVLVRLAGRRSGAART